MKILVFLFTLVIFYSSFIYSQRVNNVHLVGHTAYMIQVLQEVVLELERREWCNLKVPDLNYVVNETVLDREYFGTVTYSNGFVSSMQRVDIRQAGVDQIWSWDDVDETGTVLVRGTLRMLDMAIGYDVVADLQDGLHRYTVTITYPETHFTFNIRKNVNTEQVAVEIVGSIFTTATISRIKFLPVDTTSDVLTTLFNVRISEDGIKAWDQEVFPSILLDVYHNKVEFPRICYDCPATAT